MQYVSPCIVTISAPFSLTDCQRFFEQPATARQRQYEALRAYFLEEVPSAEAARSFGYSPGAFRVLCHAFRHGQLPDFFATGHAVRREQPRKSRAHEQIVALRKRNYSVYEISRALQEQGTPLSATAVREVLADEGFAPLPRRLDEERPERVGPSSEAVANVRDFVLSPREFTTRVGGLFLFVHDLVRLDGDALALGATLPGSAMIPAGHALRAALALKLWSIERKSHVMALVADEGLALFCGLNAMPKKSFLSEYSSRITPRKVSRLLGLWHDQVTGEALVTGESLNLDFHSVPYFGDHPLVESHYLSMRSRRQPSILTFLAQDADSQVFCYSNADIRKGEEAEEVFRFIAFWKRQHGSAPRHLVFDSKLTNDASSTAKAIITRYAKRMLIENALSDAVRFFHINALSSSVGFKVDFDMALLVIASGLYRLMARRMRGYDDAQARQIFRDLIDMPADVAITEREITVRFHRRAHLPIVLASGLIDKSVAVPWWNGRALRLVQ